MSDDTPTQTGDLGPMPEAEIEPGEENPGGADALPPDDDENVSADLDPDKNPAMEDSPDPLKEGEDTETEATKHGDDAEDVDEAPV